MTNNEEKITTSKTIKTLLFASLIAAMIMPFSNMDVVFAETEKDIMDIAREGKKLIKKIDRIEEKLSNDTLSDEKRKNLEKTLVKANEELQPIMNTLNDNGFYTPEQFKDAKAKQLSDSAPVAQAACSNCDPVVFFRTGFDWQVLDYFQGSEVADWEVTQTGDISEKEMNLAFGTDYIKPFTLLFRDHANSADVNFQVTLLNDNNTVYKTYNDHDLWIQSTSLVFPDEVNEAKYYQASSDDKVRTVLVVEYLD